MGRQQLEGTIGSEYLGTLHDGGSRPWNCVFHLRQPQQRLLWRRSQGRKPFRKLTGGARCGDRKTEVVLPGGASRSVEHGFAGRSESDRYQSERKEDAST